VTVKFKKLSSQLVLALLSTQLLFAAPASADTVQISRTFSGFEFEQTKLTALMKSQIQEWIAKNPDFKDVTCFGYTGFNVFNRSRAFMQKLARTRALATCNYVARLNPAFKVKTIGGVPSSSKNPSSRRVTITLTRQGVIEPGGSGPGDGVGVIATCDDNIKAKMRARLLRGNLYFSELQLSEISANCRGKKADFYFTDASNQELAQVKDITVNGSALTLIWSQLSVTEILSTAIAQVVVSIHD